jgi:hypothetical protein
MPITVLGGTKLADTAFSIDNSCLFDAASGAYMSKSLGTPTNAKKATYSVWIKRCSLKTHSNSNDTNSGQGIVTFKPSNGNFDSWKFNNVDKLDFYSETSATQEYWVADGPEVFRDVSAWYHVVIALDSTQSTAANRLKYYVNGTQLTNPTQTSYIDQNSDHVGLASGSTVYVGLTKAHNTNVAYADCYMAEVCFIDGTQYAASDFGEFDEDSPTIWKPKDPSGLTFGNNGFYLDFEDSSNLGNDANGGTDLTETNIAATDQSTDTPTNNFCTINPLDEPYGSVTLTEGNLQQVQTSDYPYNRATMGVAKGKWYFEGKGVATSGDSVIGIASVAASSSTNALYIPANNYAYYSHASNHGAYSNNALVVSTNYDAYTDDDIISVAFDLDNNKLYFAKNGTWANSGDPTSGSTGTGAVSITAAASTVDGFYFPAAADYGGSPRTTWSMNFGSPRHTVSSGNADANGYGNFEYSVPSGYYALCTKNLAEFG